MKETRTGNEIHRRISTCAVRIALTCGLTRPQVSSDLDVGLSSRSLPFSSSNALNRFATEASMPPYFDLYL